MVCHSCPNIFKNIDISTFFQHHYFIILLILFLIQYDDFAYYFQVTIQKYQAQGINIAAVTLQNEPLNEPNSYPGIYLPFSHSSPPLLLKLVYIVMRFTPQNESFLAKTLGPKLNNNKITAKVLNFSTYLLSPLFYFFLLTDQLNQILVYDHNWDVYQFPMQALSDSSAYQFIAGSAFHCYGGSVSNQQYVSPSPSSLLSYIHIIYLPLLSVSHLLH